MNTERERERERDHSQQQTHRQSERVYSTANNRTRPGTMLFSPCVCVCPSETNTVCMHLAKNGLPVFKQPQACSRSEQGGGGGRRGGGGGGGGEGGGGGGGEAMR